MLRERRPVGPTWQVARPVSPLFRANLQPVGNVTLLDVLFYTIVAHIYAVQRPQEIAPSILSMHTKGKLPVITFEQSMIYPAVRATVRALEEDSPRASAPRGTVFLETKMNLGGDQPTRMLPVTYTVEFFQAVANASSWFPQQPNAGGRK